MNLSFSEEIFQILLCIYGTAQFKLDNEMHVALDTLQICQVTCKFHMSALSNITIQFLINASDAHMKCATHKLCIMLCVKCTYGHHKLFNYLVSYSQYHLVLLLPSQSKGNLSEHELHSCLISSNAPKDCKILHDTRR